MLIANTFNKFFSTIAQKIESKIIRTKTKYQDFLDNPSIDSFFLTTTDPQEIKSTINSLKNNKATGPNSIPTKLLKTFVKEIKTPLSDLVNLSFECGLFPAILKIANLAPIYKKAELLECNNYRPISLLSNLSKIIEKLVHKRLTVFLEQKELFYDLQFGFRNNTSTNHALIHFTEKIRKALDNGFSACGVYIDLQKAFDTVKHLILINKLSYYGVRGIANNWFKTFLTNRQHFTSIEENSSDEITNTHGVPHGSVLGPLLFLIYINDLNKAIKNSAVYHYADDTNLLLTHKSPKKKLNKLINQYLTTLCKWLRASKISLNAAKT